MCATKDDYRREKHENVLLSVCVLYVYAIRNSRRLHTSYNMYNKCDIVGHSGLVYRLSRKLCTPHASVNEPEAERATAIQIKTIGLRRPPLAHLCRSSTIPVLVADVVDASNLQLTVRRGIRPNAPLLCTAVNNEGSLTVVSSSPCAADELPDSNR
jgi:hypothetical protein